MSKPFGRKQVADKRRLSQGVLGGCIIGFDIGILVFQLAFPHPSTFGLLAAVGGIFGAWVLVAKAFQEEGN